MHPLETDSGANVKCCDESHNKIYFDDSDNLFYLMVWDDEGFGWNPEKFAIDAIKRCPWCGILLDTNLLED